MHIVRGGGTAKWEKKEMLQDASAVREAANMRRTHISPGPEPRGQCPQLFCAQRYFYTVSFKHTVKSKILHR